MPESPGKRIRVLVTAPGTAVGGQAHAARAIVEGFREHPAIDVHLQPSDPLLPGPARCLTTLPLVRSMVRPLLFTAGLLRRVPAVDVVHVFCAAHTAFLFGSVPPLVVAWLFRKPVVLNYHDGRAEAHWRGWGWLLRRATRSARTVVFPSPYLQDIFRRHGVEGDVVPNVVDTSAFVFAETRVPAPRLVSARLLERLYAVENTIEAFALVRREIPEARLDIYGDGVSARGLERVADRVGRAGIRFHGFVRHAAMPEVFAEGGILVNSSRVDNVPHVIIEAFAAGLPIVTTPAGGITYMVEPDRTALVVPFDDPAAMAAAVLRLLREDGLSRRLTAAGRQRCAEYSWSAAERGWLAVYERVAGQRDLPTEPARPIGTHPRNPRRSGETGPS